MAGFSTMAQGSHAFAARASRRPAEAQPEDGSALTEDAAAIFARGRNVWRMERARRAAVLIDGAAFFRAVREALMKAQRTVFIVGWDIDSRCRLVGEDCTPHDDMPVAFAEFLSALVRQRPDLTVHLLLW